MNYELIQPNYKYKEQDPEYKGESFDRELASGPREERRCRDCLCLILYLAFWGAMIGVAGYAFANGNPELLTAPFDSTGFQCGVDGYKNYPYAYFNKKNISQFGCVADCPANDSSVFSTMLGGKSLDNSYFPAYATVLLVSICFPTSTAMGDAINLGLNFYDQSISDLQQTWPISLATLFLALVVSLILMLLIRALGGCLVVFVIVLYFAALISFGVLCFQTAHDRIQIDGFDQWKNPQLLQAIAYICWSVAGISFLLVLCNLRKLRIAIRVIKTTSDFTRQECQTILVPVIMFLSIGAFFVFWVYVSVYIFSCGKVKQCGGSPYSCIDWNVGVKRSLALYFVGLFWNCEVAIGICQFVIASTGVYWYFSHLHGKSPSSPVCTSFCRALSYHLGSIIFGALILCILFILQLILELLHHFGKQQTISKQPISNACSNFVIKITRCCLACFERFIRFITKNAFIMMAITGQGFFTSAHQAFYLIMRSSAQYSITHGVGNGITLLGKLLVTLICTLFGYLMITEVEYFSTNIYSPFMPTLIFFVISFVVTTLFMDVFAIGADTILLCYCLQLDILKGLSYACPAGLRATFDSQRS